MILTSLVLGLALATAPQVPDARAQAERLARAGSHQEALKQFQALAAANPDDIEARLWIARLHAWMGQTQRAVDVYESILASQPQHADALIGLGETLTAAGRLREAADALNRAESIAPDNTTLLAAQGRLNRAAGRGRLADAYYRKAIALQPDAAIRDANGAFQAERAHRIEASYDFEQFDNEASDPQSGLIEINVRASDAVRVFVGGQHQRKFSRSETRAGGGFEWTARHDLRLRGGGLFAGNALILPETDSFFDLGYSRGRAEWTAGLRFLRFEDTSTWIFSPGLTIRPTDRVALDFRLHRSHTSFSDAAGSEGNGGAGLGASYRATPRLWVNVSYQHGFEDRAIITSEYLFEQLSAETVGAGIRYDIQPMTSIVASVDRQWRANDLDVTTAFLTFIQRF